MPPAHTRRWDWPTADIIFHHSDIDMIYGIPGQADASLTGSPLHQALVYQPEELFLYPLYNVPRQKNKPSTSYVLARDLLRNAGYTQPSMRRFVLNQRRDRGSCGFETSLALGARRQGYRGDLHY